MLYKINPLSANPTKWSNTLKQFVGNLPPNCLSSYDHFVGFALKELIVWWLKTRLSFFLVNLVANNLQLLLKGKYITDTIVGFFEKFLEGDHSFSTYAKFSEKTTISYLLIRTHTCAYQGVRNGSFSENFSYVLTGRSQVLFWKKHL